MSANPPAADVVGRLARGLQPVLAACDVPREFIVFSAPDGGMVEKVDIAAVERNFDTLYALCREFEFHPPATSALVASLEILDYSQLAGRLGGGATTLSAKRTWFRYSGIP
eukprot:15473576-Alexandrium_andersonii.AAC.1